MTGSLTHPAYTISEMTGSLTHPADIDAMIGAPSSNAFFKIAYDLTNPINIQKICAEGKAPYYFDIGDEITIPWTDNSGDIPVLYEYPFVVVDIADCEDPNGNVHENALWLMAKYSTPKKTSYDMIFDAPEQKKAEGTFQAGLYYYKKSGQNYVRDTAVVVGETIPANTYYIHELGAQDVIRYGYNRWRDSAYRQWLNSDAEKNVGWWIAQHTYDVSPHSVYTNRPGWLNGFSAEWKYIFKPIKVQTAKNSLIDITYDKFFIPSVEQMYGSPSVANVEGKYWPYCKTVTELESPSNGSQYDLNDARKFRSINDPTGKAYTVFLRSAYSSYNVWTVNAAGYITNNVAANSDNITLPATVIY